MADTEHALTQRVGPVKLLILQGTPFCNIDCAYCYLPHRNQRGRMSVETVNAVIDNLLSSDMLRGPLLVNWHAGEPLVLPASYYAERMPLFDRVVAAGIPVTHSLQTNAMLVSEEHCDLFLRYDVKVGVSIDGPAHIHDRKRQTRNGQGTHAAAMAGIARMQNRGVSFNAICVLSDLSVRHPDEIYSFFKDLGVRAVGFNIEEIEGVNKTSSITTDGFDDRFLGFLERVWQRAEADHHVMRIREFDDAEGRLLDKHPRRNSQTEPFINLSVAYDGDFSTFCPELLGNSSETHADFVFGNVHTTPLRDTLRHPNFVAIKSEIDAGVEACRETCAYFAVCAGGNPSNKLAENGAFDSTETLNCHNRVKLTADFMMDKLEARADSKRRAAAVE
jgi:uncharacterized protein